MARSEKHRETYQDNKRVYSEEFFNHKENFNWKVTIIFYAAIHLIEGNLPDNVPCHNHEERYNIITKSYSKIVDPYDILYKLSIKARYKCVKIKDRDVKTALMSLEKIESSLAS